MDKTLITCQRCGATSRETEGWYHMEATTAGYVRATLLCPDCYRVVSKMLWAD